MYTEDEMNGAGDSARTTGPATDAGVAASSQTYVSAIAALNPDRGYQWYLDGFADGASNGTGANVDAISTEYTGRGVVVGLIDEGFDTTNPDLAGRFDLALSYDPRDRGVADIMPDSSAAVHGTMVAGVLGASADNGFGMVGVASEATLAGFYTRYGFGGSSRAEVADLLARQAGVDVSNNSWGYTIAFSDNFRDPAWAGVANALHTGVTQGREGLGTVYVFAAGNDRQYIANTLNYDGDNTNYHSLTNSRFTITVAASTEDGHIAPFSTPGASILVTAPGDWMVTTTVNNNDGNPDNDFAFVSGTSFATPIVSGIVAMMLEANPDLGYRDVQEILALSAHKIDAGAPSWSANGATNWNGGANLVSNDFGFGLVDAHAAVRLAETWTGGHDAANESVISVAGSVGGNTAIVDFHPLSYTVTVPATFADFSIDWVEVDVSLLHSHVGDLRIHLISPTGTDSLLMDMPAAGNDARTNLTFTFSTTHDWGESPVGTWTLVVEDDGTGGTGSMVSYAMRFYGDEQGNDHTYYYTDDFATLSGDRGTISDPGGHDTINAAAVTSNLSIDLHSGATSMIAGRAVTIAAGTMIETVYGGDGNDIIVGNDAGNHLSGGHGNDVILGGRGDDVIDGGHGADIMTGGAGNDTYMVDNASDVVIEHAGEGTDTVVTGLSHTLEANVENLTLTGSDNIDGVGNDLDNVIVSNAGVDRLIGGNGDDVYYVHNSLDHVIEAPGGGNDTVYADVDFTLPENVETLVLVSSSTSHVMASALQGVTFASAAAAPIAPELPDFDKIDGYGNEIDNVMIGTPGDNLLNGGHGADIMMGGAGNDIYVVDNLGDRVVENPGDGIDVVYAAVDYTLGDNVEHLILWGSDSLHVSGNALDNTIFGNNAGNTIDGGAGNDAIVGGAGDDIISGGDGNDWIYGGAGNDLISGGTGNNVMAGIDGDDTLIGGDSDDWLEGDAGNDVLFGGGGNDVMLGGDGDDRIDGGAGNDGMVGGAGNDILIGGDGNDWIGGDAGDDLLIGGAGADVLAGGDGNDRLIGGSDRDFLVGGAGADTFVFNAPGEGGDFIWDFERGVDTIEINRAGYGVAASASLAFAEGDGLPADFGADAPVAYVDQANHTLWFDPTGGSSADAVLIAGFVQGMPGHGDVLFA